MDAASAQRDGALTRRRFVGRACALGLGGVGAGALAACGHGGRRAASATPATTAVAAPPPDPALAGPLRVISPVPAGAAVAAYRAARPQVRLEFSIMPADGIERLARTDPGAFDVALVGYDQVDGIWPAGGLAPIATERLPRWGGVSPLLTRGTLQEGALAGDGDAPFRRLFVRSGTTLAGPAEDTGSVALVPASNTASAFAYDTAALGPQSSWRLLVDPQLRGHVALRAAPRLGLLEAAIAVEAAGVLAFADVGQPTRDEIDQLVAYLVELQARGQFRAFWRTPAEAAALATSGDVAALVLPWRTLAAAQAQRLPFVEASPAEGYVGSGLGHVVSAQAAGDAALARRALDYAAWWHEAAASAAVVRGGDYAAVPESAVAGLDPAETAYWLDGEAAPEAISAVQPGGVAVAAGSRRDGGSYAARCGRFVAWESSYPEEAYAASRWRQLLAATPS